MSWDGKIYDKYRIEHTDGTPLKGKKYFVLRLDSDDPVEAARVAAAMRSYKSKPRQCDVGTAEEQTKRFHDYCEAFMDNDGTCTGCPCCGHPFSKCEFVWAQMPYEDDEKGEVDDTNG